MFKNKELAGFTENCWWHLLITFFRRPLLYSAPLDVLAMPKEEKKWEKLYAWMSDLVNSCLPLFFQCFWSTYVSIPVILLETKILNPMLKYDLSSNITSEENLCWILQYYPFLWSTWCFHFQIFIHLFKLKCNSLLYLISGMIFVIVIILLSSVQV